MFSSKYDSIIEKYRGAVPLAFVKSVIYYESSFNPSNRTGSYIGLMQLGPSVREDYGISEADCLNPEINIRVGCAKLNTIVKAYSRSANMQPNWSSVDYAALVYLGYNAGSSASAGVQYVTDVLGRLGMKPTVDNVYAVVIAGQAPNATSQLRNRAKIDYSKKVAYGYMDASSISLTSPENLKYLVIAGIAGLVYWLI